MISYKLNKIPFIKLLFAVLLQVFYFNGLGQTGQLRFERIGPEQIPDKIKHKIFKPFVTTKPTGEGTGLALSLSYDIVEAHGGEYRGEAEEGEGLVFIITLPCLN